MNITDENDQGVVFRKSTGHYTVHTNGHEIDCELSSRLHKLSTHHTADPVAVGDQVRFLDAGHGCGIITEILPRRSSFSRPLPVPGPAGESLPQPASSRARPSAGRNRCQRGLLEAAGRLGADMFFIWVTDLWAGACRVRLQGTLANGRFPAAGCRWAGRRLVSGRSRL